MVQLKLTSRQRLLIFTALHIYDQLVKSTKAGLEKLNLAVMDIEVAESRSGLTMNAVESTKDGEKTELTAPLVLCLADALSLHYAKLEAQKKALEKLQAGTSEIEEPQHELKALATSMADQSEIPFDVTAGVADGEGAEELGV